MTVTTIHRSFLNRHVAPESDGLLLTITCDAHVDTSLDAVAQANKLICNFAAAKAFKALKLLVRSGSYLQVDIAESTSPRRLFRYPFAQSCRHQYRNPPTQKHPNPTCESAQPAVVRVVTEYARTQKNHLLENIISKHNKDNETGTTSVDANPSLPSVRSIGSACSLNGNIQTQGTANVVQKSQLLKGKGHP